MLVYMYTGIQLYWYKGIQVYWYNGMQLYWYTGILVYMVHSNCMKMEASVKGVNFSAHFCHNNTPD